jgi:uncharacterized cupin superfamily protein
MAAARPDFFGNLMKGLRSFDHRGEPDMAGKGNRLGDKLGLKRIGVNFEITPPGCRSSHPHAESHEEEFVLILKGKPDVWIDGELFALEEGDCVAFPSGTGIAHSFLNNSDADVHLLIIGEHNKPGNQLYYPLNAQRMEDFAKRDRAWFDAPKRPLGPHDGKARAGTRKD